MFARTAFVLYKLYGLRPYNHLTCILTTAICFHFRKQLNVAHYIKYDIILGYIVLIILSIES